MRIRRASTAGGHTSFHNPFPGSASRLRSVQTHNSGDKSGHTTPWDETAPLLGEGGRRPGSSQNGPSSYGASDSKGRNRSRRTSRSSHSSRPKLATVFSGKDSYDINHPPSVPGSPTFGSVDPAEMTFGDVMLRDDLAMKAGSPRRNIGGDDMYLHQGDGEDHHQEREHRRSHVSGAAGDVCFPVPEMSELGDDEGHARDDYAHQHRSRRRRRHWPDLGALDEWMLFEKEDRSDEQRVKKITEPQLINGRLRPVRKGWFQTDEDAPFRFTYFNEEFQSTIHSQTISELVQPGSSFRELFVPDPRVLSDDESDSGDDTVSNPSRAPAPSVVIGETDSKQATRQPSVADVRKEAMSPPPQEGATASSSRAPSIHGSGIQSGIRSMESSMLKGAPTSATEDTERPEKPVKYGDRPVWWLDILCPTEAEMKVISKAFGIHPLTAEDIMMQEAREKVELFRNYYFVNYRTFDQDLNSENYLEPVNMYVVVFREGVLSFHFSMTPHAANVRRRIRQLRDYLLLSSDWISYAIIDDITDVFQPLIQTIEDEVDEIDDAILKLHSGTEESEKKPSKGDDASSMTITDTSSDMLRKVGDCRKRVMSLYRLLGNKADVIKGFAKRCNERWEVAPKSEIGLYLGDIQDHIITMTSNLGHYEKYVHFSYSRNVISEYHKLLTASSRILARAHGNYLAQINIRMNERQEQTADVLGRLTVLGTIVLPMNIITGLWGMNVWVPGQEYEGDLQWFFWITAGLIVFGLACYLAAKRVYKIV